MSKYAVSMVKDGVQSYINRDVEAALTAAGFSYRFFNEKFKKHIAKHIPPQKHNRFDKQKNFKTLLELRCDTEINGKPKGHPNGTKTTPKTTSELHSENARRKNIFPEFWVKFYPEKT